MRVFYGERPARDLDDWNTKLTKHTKTYTKKDSLRASFGIFVPSRFFFVIDDAV